MNETPAPPSPRVDALSRLLIIALALASLFLAGFWMTKISRVDPWYRNTDMNMQNLDDALSINSDVPPRLIDQPGLPLTCLLAIDYRVRHYLSLLPVWNVKKFGDSKDPLREIPVLIRIGRVHSRVLVVLFILSAAWLTYSVSRAIEPACLTVILLSGSSGLLFHGLLTRPSFSALGSATCLPFYLRIGLSQPDRGLATTSGSFSLELLSGCPPWKNCQECVSCHFATVGAGWPPSRRLSRPDRAELARLTGVGSCLPLVAAPFIKLWEL